MTANLKSAPPPLPGRLPAGLGVFYRTGAEERPMGETGVIGHPDGAIQPRSTMFTRLDAYRSPAILSFKLRVTPVRLALVITASPTLARAVADYLRENDRKLSVIWLPTVASACRRLEWEHADMVVVDEAIASTDEVIDTLHAAAPEADVRRLAGGSAES